MNIAKRIKNAIQALKGQTVELNHKELLEWLGISTTNYKAVSEVTYYTCLKLLAETLGKMPLKYYQQTERGKGIGTWATEITRDFAFEKLKLHRLELDVYSFNPRAEKVYLKAGFKRDGVLRDAIMDGDSYADDIIMSILEDEWKALKQGK